MQESQDVALEITKSLLGEPIVLKRRYSAQEVAAEVVELYEGIREDRKFEKHPKRSLEEQERLALQLSAAGAKLMHQTGDKQELSTVLREERRNIPSLFQEILKLLRTTT
ncbi:MAG: hypothetical protein HY533_05985 [Chloroflexi bacterium]|nr:hypothetical protein [Chloroflexota bacterium]